MKTIHLFFDFEFTSLSPDAQPISLGIVSDPFTRLIQEGEQLPFKTAIGKEAAKVIESHRSFYAEFSDFDINRCDDWVKENVVGKLKYYGTPRQDKMFIDSSIDEGTIFGSQNTAEIKGALHKWLFQFSDYNIQFVCDCGTFDWYWMLQLLAEWDEKEIETDNDNVIYDWLYPLGITVAGFEECYGSFKNRVGLPKLPANISPVPQDLNDLIALKKGVSVREAFDIDREELAYGFVRKFFTDVEEDLHLKDAKDYGFKPNHQLLKHNALWDAKVIKAIYEKLK